MEVRCSFPRSGGFLVCGAIHPASHSTEQIPLRRIADLELEALESLTQTVAPESGTPTAHQLDQIADAAPDAAPVAHPADAVRPPDEPIEQ